MVNADQVWPLTQAVEAAAVRSTEVIALVKALTAMPGPKAAVHRKLLCVALDDSPLTSLLGGLLAGAAQEVQRLSLSVVRMAKFLPAAILSEILSEHKDTNVAYTVNGQRLIPQLNWMEELEQ